MKTQRKVLKKSGNQLRSYPIGEQVSFKWHITWTIWKTVYDTEKDKTYIYLEK